MSTSRGCPKAIRAKGLFCHSTPTAPATTANTPEAGQGGQGHPDPGRPRPGVRHRVDPGLLARGKGALGASCSAPCRSACPRNSGSRHHRHGRGQPLPQGGLPATTQRPLRDRPRTAAPIRQSLHRRARRILCITRITVSNDNTVRYKRLALQIPDHPAATAARPGSASIPRRHNGVFHAMSGANHADGQPIDSQTREAA